MTTDPLSLYLRAAAAAAFDWRRRNCGLWVADWVAARTGRDPAAAYRVFAGDYRALDVPQLAAEVMAAFPETGAPARGDVGVVLTPQPTAAIYTGRRWAALAPRGLAVAAWPCLKAWAVDRA